MVTLKTNLIRWVMKSPGVWTSLLDGSTIEVVAPPSTTVTTLWGAYTNTNTGEDYTQANTRLATATGAPIQCQRLYDKNNPGLGNGAKQVLAWATAAGMGWSLVPMCLSFKLYPANVIAGDYDAMLIAFATTVAAAASVSCIMWFCYWHEMDNLSLNASLFTVAEWQDAWIYVMELVAAHLNAYCKRTAIWTSYEFSTRLGQYYNAIAPYVDTVGVDPYGSTSKLNAQTLIQPYYDLVMSLNGPTFAIWETGFQSGTEAQVMNWFTSLAWFDGKAVAVTIFNDAGYNTEIDNILVLGQPVVAQYYGTLETHTA